MALYISHNIFHLARLLYVRPETFGPYYLYRLLSFGLQFSIIFGICCCSLLCLVVVSLIYIFLVSLKMVLLHQKSFISFVVKKGVPGCSEKSNLDWCQSFSPFCSKRPNFASVWQNGESQCIIYFYPWKFLDQSWRKVLFGINSIWKILLIFVE